MFFLPVLPLKNTSEEFFVLILTEVAIHGKFVRAVVTMFVTVTPKLFTNTSSLVIAESQRCFNRPIAIVADCAVRALKKGVLV